MGAHDWEKRYGCARRRDAEYVVDLARVALIMRRWRYFGGGGAQRREIGFANDIDNRQSVVARALVQFSYDFCPGCAI